MKVTIDIPEELKKSLEEGEYDAKEFVEDSMLRCTLMRKTLQIDKSKSEDCISLKGAIGALLNMRTKELNRAVVMIGIAEKIRRMNKHEIEGMYNAIH